jgi:hypothetical protein
MRLYLNNDPTWQAFLPKLMSATEQQSRFGLGITLGERQNHSLTSLAHLMSDGSMTSNESEDGAGMNHGSQFAKSLGFYEELGWDDMNHDSDGEDEISDNSLNRHDSTDSHGNRLSAAFEELESPGSDTGSRLSGSLGRNSWKDNMFVPTNMQEEDSDIVDGILSPSEALEVSLIIVMTLLLLQ